MMSLLTSVAMSLIGIHVVCHILLAQQRTASYKHTSLPRPVSKLDFQVVMMELHATRNIYCGLSSLQAYRQGVLLQKKKKKIILVTWITAWTGKDETDVREPDE